MKKCYCISRIPFVLFAADGDCERERARKILWDLGSLWGYIEWGLLFILLGRIGNRGYFLRDDGVIMGDCIFYGQIFK